MFMQMYTVTPHHVVSVFRIDKEVGMRSCVNACPQETDAMLGYTGRVGTTDNNFKTAFQISRFFPQV